MISSSEIKPIIIVGCTASGKSDLALQISQKISGEIINADSRQIYKDIPVISAQPSDQFQQEIKHHLYGHKAIYEDYSVGIWIQEVTLCIKDVISSGKIPIIVGGTGMYIQALTSGIAEIPSIPKSIREEILHDVQKKGIGYIYNQLESLDIESYKRLSPNDTQRIIRAFEVAIYTSKPLSYYHKLSKKKPFEELEFLKLYLTKPRNIIYENCNSRFIKMLENGAIEEVENLINMQTPEEYYSRAIGIREIANYLHKISSKEEAIEKSQQLTRNYAKRQMTWFNNQCKDFIQIHDHNLDDICSLL